WSRLKQGSLRHGLEVIRPHPEHRRLRRVTHDEQWASWFETAQCRRLAMRRDRHQIGFLWPSNNAVLTWKAG
ncbi:MAG TPA: hypothetical protein VEN78_29190, partial [Bradyrhizobium sp.]|nr:hypothetical protein [Bradyrhizobium sp.]